MKVANGSVMDKPAVTKAEFGKRWQISERQVERLLSEGLPCIRIGHRTLRIEPLSADRWIEKHFTTKP